MADGSAMPTCLVSTQCEITVNKASEPLVRSRIK